MISEKEVREQLREVIDPELDVNIVDLGLIYDIEVEEEVHILMTLTSPGCPLSKVFDDLIKEALRFLEGVEKEDITIELTFEPRWSPEKMSDRARDQVGYIPGHGSF
ncbi:MAG: iron-sulfur cluster assembly protein [Candidatus Nanohaloarchaea archaeon]|nr:iron-sulfur cluster assembly protein [Candidatus Nanohaloarchaea archaeon]